jgi:predicted RNA-binding protein Jag
MKIFDKIVQKKIKKELKDWGVDKAQLNVDISGISPKDLIKMQKKFKEFISKHPALKNLKLDNLPALLKHKDQIKKIFEENKEEVQTLLKEIKRDK